MVSFIVAFSGQCTPISYYVTLTPTNLVQVCRCGSYGIMRFQNKSALLFIATGLIFVSHAPYALSVGTDVSRSGHFVFTVKYLNLSVMTQVT